MAEGQETQSSTSSSSQNFSHMKSQVPTSSGLTPETVNVPTFPMMYPAIVPGLFAHRKDEEHVNHGRGLYAVPVPFMQPGSGFTSNALIPFTYNLPTERNVPEAREMGGEQGQTGEQQQQQAGPQRQVVRRLQIAIHIDILLILKLVAVVFLFNQDGSKQRLTLLVIFATLVYLYQTGALAPLVRWLSQGMQRAVAPARPPRPAVRANNIHADEGQGNENANLVEHPVGENENQPAIEGNRLIENENAAELGQNQGANRWWAIVKEIQIVVFGFITSLLPGFHNVD